MIVAVVVVVLGPVFDPVVRLQRSKLLALDLSPGGSVKDPYLGAGGPHAACRGCNTGLRDGSPFCVSGTLGRGALTRSLAPLFLDRHGGAAGRARVFCAPRLARALRAAGAREGMQRTISAKTPALEVPPATSSARSGARLLCRTCRNCRRRDEQPRTNREQGPAVLLAWGFRPCSAKVRLSSRFTMYYVQEMLKLA